MHSYGQETRIFTATVITLVSQIAERNGESRNKFHHPNVVLAMRTSCNLRQSYNERLSVVNYGRIILLTLGPPILRAYNNFLERTRDILSFSLSLGGVIFIRNTKQRSHCCPCHCPGHHSSLLRAVYRRYATACILHQYLRAKKRNSDAYRLTARVRPVPEIYIYISLRQNILSSYKEGRTFGINL